MIRDMVSAITATTDQVRLDQLEATIADGRRAFLAVGEALLAVKAERLYRLRGFTTFEAYCSEKWGFTHRYANRLLAAFRFAKECAAEGKPAPANEHQARRAMDAAARTELQDLAVETSDPTAGASAGTGSVDAAAAPAQEPSGQAQSIEPHADGGEATERQAAGLTRQDAEAICVSLGRVVTLHRSALESDRLDGIIRRYRHELVASLKRERQPWTALEVPGLYD